MVVAVISNLDAAIRVRIEGAIHLNFVTFHLISAVGEYESSRPQIGQDNEIMWRVEKQGNAFNIAFSYSDFSPG